MEDTEVRKIEQLLEYHFSDVKLLKASLTHTSQADNRLQSNERLEFLGDSVLGLIICQTLYERFPTYDEGDLTKIKSMIVSRKTCSKVAKKYQLASFTMVGKGMAKISALSGSISAGTLEAVIAAIYIDGGFDQARDFIIRAFGELIDRANSKQHHENFKSLLQQYSQSNFNCTPLYTLLDEKGPDHNKCFEVEAMVNYRRFESAWGVTKKDAEQKAAYNALVELKQIEPVDEGPER